MSVEGVELAPEETWEGGAEGAALGAGRAAMTPDPARCALAWSSRSMEMSVYGVELAPEETWEETREEGAAEAAPPGAWCAAVTPRRWWPSFSSSSLRSWRSRAISSACRLLS